MKVAILQPNPTAGDISGAMAQIDVALAAASKQGAKMLVAPELMLPGYHCPDVHRAAAQDQSGEWMVTLAAMARHYRCGLTIGGPNAMMGIASIMQLACLTPTAA